MPENLPDPGPIPQSPAIQGIPRRVVGLWGIILITAHLVVCSTILFVGLLVLWPAAYEDASKGRPEASASKPAVALQRAVFTSGDPTSIHSRLSGWLEGEARLLAIVILSGALGGLVHAIRSVFWYVGNRELIWSWVVMYLLLPFVGAALAALFYFVIRGGFFAPQARFDQTSPAGFAALAGLVGLFSQQAILKLKQVAEVVFIQAGAGKDHEPPQPKNSSIPN